MGKDIEYQLRLTVDEADIHLPRIAASAGIEVADLQDFLWHNKSLTLSQAARLAEYLGFELRPRRTKDKTHNEIMREANIVLGRKNLISNARSLAIRALTKERGPYYC